MSNDAKQNIPNAIRQFNEKNLFEASINLFNVLGYDTKRQNRFESSTVEAFLNNFVKNNDKISDVEKFKEKALTQKWKSIELLFQLTKDERE